MSRQRVNFFFTYIRKPQERLLNFCRCKSVYDGIFYVHSVERQNNESRKTRGIFVAVAPQMHSDEFRCQRDDSSGLTLVAAENFDRSTKKVRHCHEDFHNSRHPAVFSFLFLRKNT